MPFWRAVSRRYTEPDIRVISIALLLKWSGTPFAYRPKAKAMSK